MNEYNRVLGMRYDGTITLGHILTFIGFLLAGIGAYEGAKIELRSVNLRLQIVEKQIEGLPNVLTLATRQDERTGQIDGRLNRLESRILRLEDRRK